MALFKRKKKEEAKTEEEKETKKEKVKLGLPQGKDPRFYKIVEKPVVTEKAVGSSLHGRAHRALAGQNKYVFRVGRKTNKIEVRKAVEKLYEVKVKDVKIINTIGKKRQVGRFEGWKPGFKKAVVTLEKGFTIEPSHT